MRATVEFDDLRGLQDKIKQLPNISEGIINQVLHVDGVEIVVKEMTELMPQSKQNKKHAKQSKWSSSQAFNLGFRVFSKGGAANKKGSFGYLVFPDEGRGPSNPWAQHFSDRSLIRATPKILELLDIELTNKIQEAL